MTIKTYMCVHVQLSVWHEVDEKIVHFNFVYSQLFGIIFANIKLRKSCMKVLWLLLQTTLVVHVEQLKKQ